MTLVSRTKAWKHLASLRDKTTIDLKDAFKKDPSRGKNFNLDTGPITYNFSRQLVDAKILDGLVRLANESGLQEKIYQMFNGNKINKTEGRAVLHIALRNFKGKPVYVDGKDVMHDVMVVLTDIERFSNEVHSGKRLGVTGKPIKNILAVGIGGSQLGPEYLAEALKGFAKSGMNLAFVANVDGTDFVRKSEDLDPAETMVIVISKTFTTAETMKNAETAKKWMMDKLGNSPDVIKKHFVAVSTAKAEVEKFGIDTSNMFGFWDWVGGRFSASSAVGALPLSLFLGFNNFKQILDGAQWIDQHFLNTPFISNIPVISALIDIWNVNFMGYPTRAILPYSQAWHRYAAHCQQVEMESNGKRVTIDGEPVDFETGEVVFGEPGTNGQHSFYQELHQGRVVPADFIGFIKPQYTKYVNGGAITHHEELMTNFFAQPDALAFGKADANQHKYFPGNRPSNVFLLNEQNPFAAGVLLSLLEHRTAVKGFIWDINSFDQFGVELGKVLGKDMRNRIAAYKADPNDPKVFEGLNSATADTFRKFLKGSLEV